MFRPIVPKVPAVGGVMTEFPETKQPPAASVAAWGATAVHFAHMADDVDRSHEPPGPPPTALPHVIRLVTPAVLLQPPLTGPLHHIMEFCAPLKSLGFPKKSHRSVLSPVPAKLLLESFTTHGWGL